MIAWIKRVYLDHNATTAADPAVVRLVNRVMSRAAGNPSSLHTVGRQAKYLLEEARARVASALGCDPAHIIFTSGGTEGNNTVLKGVFAGRQSRGTLVTSALEHESVLGSAQQLEAAGVRVIRLGSDRLGRIAPGQIGESLSGDVGLVSIMHGNNETGAVNDVAAIGRLCRERGILFHVDAVQTFGKIPVNPEAIGCDFLTVSAHKINGPKGCGALYVKDIARLQSLIYGGDQERSLRAGTENVHSVAGFGLAAKLRMQKMAADYQYLQQWRRQFVSGLRQIYPEVQVNESPEQLPGTMSLTFTGENNLHLLAALDCYGIEVSIGSACTADRIVPSHVLLGMGFDESYALSTIRISASAANSKSDLRYVLKVFQEIKRRKLDNFGYLMPEHLTPERRRSAYLIDIRWPYERLLRPSLPEAHEVNALRFEVWRKTVPDDREIIMMCSTGVISGLNGYKLAARGFQNVKVLYGGYAALPDDQK